MEEPDCLAVHGKRGEGQPHGIAMHQIGCHGDRCGGQRRDSFPLRPGLKSLPGSSVCLARAWTLALRDGRGHGLQVTCGEVVLDLDQSDSRIVIHIPFLVSESRSLRSERTKIRKSTLAPRLANQQG